MSSRKARRKSTREAEKKLVARGKQEKKEQTE
jgi:hypothetical protein